MFVALTAFYLILRPGWFHYFFYRGNPKHNAHHACNSHYMCLCDYCCSGW